jgi:hypothetical protein
MVHLGQAYKSLRYCTIQTRFVAHQQKTDGWLISGFSRKRCRQTGKQTACLCVIPHVRLPDDDGFACRKGYQAFAAEETQADEASSTQALMHSASIARKPPVIDIGRGGIRPPDSAEYEPASRRTSRGWQGLRFSARCRPERGDRRHRPAATGAGARSATR